ncbi:MAG: hypothetical protein D6677_08340 [Calditrichaeota bacterium]|nr:MAG: hypothetical protein D6677_08340 [Calditrichota bacterium]
MRNRFTLSEWNASIADMGTMLPLAFALAYFNGMQAVSLFFLWGIVYIISGWWFRLPISVQPLKAMSVIAIAAAMPGAWLSTAAVLYGFLLLLLSLSGMVDVLQRWFSPAIVTGIQTGIGLILLQKALELVTVQGWWLHQQAASGMPGLLALLILAPLLYWVNRRYTVPVALLAVLMFMGYPLLSGAVPLHMPNWATLIHPVRPSWGLTGNLLIALIIPQLPLTLGNAMYAASDVCHHFWPERARRVSPKKLGISIGVFDIFIGGFGGFPMCHGAGGMGAYKQFGARTGGTVIITGSLLVVLALFGAADALFYIPVPLLGALLALDALRMAVLIKNLKWGYQWLTAVTVALVSLLTRNLTLALFLGLLVERVLFAPRWRERRNMPAFYAIWRQPVASVPLLRTLYHFKEDKT